METPFLIDVTIDHAALPLGKLYELVRHNAQTATVFYTLPAALIAAGMSTADGQDITEVRIDGLHNLFDTVTPGHEGADGRISSAGEPVALATFGDTEARDGHEYASASITGLQLRLPGRQALPLTATVRFIETLEGGVEIEHDAELTPADFPGDLTGFDTAAEYERYLYDREEDLWDLVAEDDRDGWNGADADGIDLDAHPLEQRVEIEVRAHLPRTPQTGGPAADPAGPELGDLTLADLPQIVRVLAHIADNTDPDLWEDLLSQDQKQLIHRVCRTRNVLDGHDRAARYAPELPGLTGNALERLLALAGLNPLGHITVGPRHIDLIVTTAIEEGLLPAEDWDISQNRAGCRLFCGDGQQITVDVSELIPTPRGPVPAREAARHILTVLHRHLGRHDDTDGRRDEVP
ncbi:hypothetical protein GCM10009839_14350 [Catenulispora yoronensis]|uniref:Uncharacterized protein n=1 Tax=Catenulispora yoronensis TaxID=450799 RepID=A0ABN2TTA7_9ACTN